MIPSGYRNSQPQLQPEFPRSPKPGITAHSLGKRWAQTLLSNEKEVGTDKSSFFSPLKYGTASEQQDGALAHLPPIPLPCSPFPRPPFILCSGCPLYPRWISQTWQNPTVLSPNTSFCPWGHSSVTHMCTRNSSSCITTIFWTLFSRHRFPNHHKHQARHCKGSTAQMPADCFFLFFFFLSSRKSPGLGKHQTTPWQGAALQAGHKRGSLQCSISGSQVACHVPSSSSSGCQARHNLGEDEQLRSLFSFFPQLKLAWFSLQLGLGATWYI